MYASILERRPVLMEGFEPQVDLVDRYREEVGVRNMSVAVSDSFDDLRAPGVRFLEEASRLGPVNVYLWSDRLVERFSGHLPKFPQAERQYFLAAIRYVSQVILVDDLPGSGLFPPDLVIDLVAAPGEDHPAAVSCGSKVCAAWRSAQSKQGGFRCRPLWI